MVLVTGTARLLADRREAAIDAIRAVVAPTLEEPGRLVYAFAFDIHEPDLVRISEESSDAASLDAHLTTPHVAVFGDALAGMVAEPPSVTRWIGAKARPLAG